MIKIILCWSVNLWFQIWGLQPHKWSQDKSEITTWWLKRQQRWKDKKNLLQRNMHFLQIFSHFCLLSTENTETIQRGKITFWLNCSLMFTQHLWPLMRCNWIDIIKGLKSHKTKNAEKHCCKWLARLWWCALFDVHLERERLCEVDPHTSSWCPPEKRPQPLQHCA